MTDYIDNLINRRAALSRKVNNLLDYLPDYRDGRTRTITAPEIEAAAVALECDRGIKTLYARELQFTSRSVTRKQALWARKWYDSLTYRDLLDSYEQANNRHDLGFIDWLYDTALESYYDQVYDR
jgi:hypothetical protein